MSNQSTPSSSSSRLFPLSLSVREASRQSPANPTNPNPNLSSRQRDLLALQDSQRAKKEYESLTDRWSDLLMESKSVDREVFRRAANHLQPGHYREITHERHLDEVCSYPLCGKKPRKQYTSDSRFRLTPKSKGKSRDIVEIQGNPDDGYCSNQCRARSIWYERNLSEEPVWARAQISLMGGSDGGSEDREVAKMVLLEDMEDRGEVAWSPNGQMEYTKPKKKSRVTGAMPISLHKQQAEAPNPSTFSHVDTSHHSVPISLPNIPTKPQPSPKPTTSISRSSSGSRPSDNPLSSFPSPLLDSLRIVERTPSTATPPPPPSFEATPAFRDTIALKGLKGWSSGGRGAIMSSPSKPSPSLSSTTTITTSKPSSKPKSNPLADRKRLELARRQFSSTSSTISASLLNLPDDADNVADFSRVLGAASRQGAESVKGRERMEASAAGQGRVFGGVDGRMDVQEAEEEEEDETEESEDEDVRFAFEQAELAQQQLKDGTFH